MGLRKDNNSYHTIKIDGIGKYSHRVLYEKYNGIEIPEVLMIDHINRIKTDNRIDNLRLVSRSQNTQNRPKRRDNISGYKNIYWHTQSEKWRVQLTVNGKRLYYGSYSDIKDAIQKRDEAIIALNLQGHLFSI